ncbi:NADH dehydrogenase [ubiquinone] 1 alpha subcomplex assembly factor 2-like [Arctopsyche grandis]|uniref:NADH dehydrogenase [ubiquinone] 1 alpha subcomplex assembly factor 2-like n=1 Tax=Arctopsyche grandis TaxID=121162 RepID=UPI00406D6A56
MTRRVWLNAWNNLVASFKPKQITGNHKGTDYIGNKYYEIPADPSRGKRRPERWFEATTGESGFDNYKPAEWESWLRHRRSEPPTDEEIQKNLAIMEMKKTNAALLDKKFGKVNEISAPNDIKGMDSFPKYPEYQYGRKK